MTDYKKDQKIKDELCACGAKKSEHAPRGHRINGILVEVPGHGSCKKTGCKQFTWDSFIFETDARRS